MRPLFLTRANSSCIVRRYSAARSSQPTPGRRREREWRALERRVDRGHDDRPGRRRGDVPLSWQLRRALVAAAGAGGRRHHRVRIGSVRRHGPVDCAATAATGGSAPAPVDGDRRRRHARAPRRGTVVDRQPRDLRDVRGRHGRHVRRVLRGSAADPAAPHRPRVGRRPPGWRTTASASCRCRRRRRRSRGRPRTPPRR